MRGSFSSTLLASAFSAACAGEPAPKRDGRFKVTLLTPGRQRLSAKAQLQMHGLWNGLTVGRWRSTVFGITLRQ